MFKKWLELWSPSLALIFWVGIVVNNVLATVEQVVKSFGFLPRPVFRKAVVVDGVGRHEVGKTPVWVVVEIAHLDRRAVFEHVFVQVGPALFFFSVNLADF